MLRSLLLLPFLVLSLAAQSVPTLVKPLDRLTLTLGQSAGTIELKDHFALPSVTGEVAQFSTYLGKINVELLADSAPKTVANFKAYINAGSYDGCIIHRTVANFVVQGGGYKATVPITEIPQLPAVANEFKITNSRGTIAMAKLDQLPDSATNQWFFNTGNNSALLDPQNGGFTVFARVIGGGMNVVDSIASIPIYNLGPGGAFESIPLKDIASGQTTLLVKNLVTIDTIRIVPLFPAATGDASVVSFNLANETPAVATAKVEGSKLVVTPVSAGMTAITVEAVDSNGGRATSVMQVTVVGDLYPVFQVQPRDAQVAPGSTVGLYASVTGAVSYQWLRNGVALPGENNSVLLLSKIDASKAGDYQLEATNFQGRTLSRTAKLAVDAAAPSLLSNLSVRVDLSAKSTLTAGFVSEGSREVLVRAAGPALEALTNMPCMKDPALELFKDTTSVLANDQWDASLASVFNQVGAFGFPAGSKDAALTKVVSGAHSAQLTSKDSGLVIAEVYDVKGDAAARLTNVSARYFSGTGVKVLTVGFTLSDARGSGARTVLIRGAGPVLGQFGVTGYLADPVIEVYDSKQTLIATNDNWNAALAPLAKGLGAFDFPLGSKDAALVLTLPAGGYTVMIKDAKGGTGEGLVEVYDVP